MKKGKVEVLAPAGSFDSMKAAVSAGADAVYIGGSRFGARAYADNLDQDRMLEAIDYAHIHGVSIYMTVNTLVKEREFEDLYDYLLPYYERGLDAVIVQDFGVLRAVRRWFPDLHVHASTQMTITGADGAAVLKELGASRVVTARELSLKELQEIHRQVDIEIESFVHGALCYCYSGQCLLSSLIGGRSGNRGRCAQPCRLPYEIRNGEGRQNPGGQKYVMSMKDLCMLDILPDILESGVFSLKIEGRMKSPRYTAGVVSIYRKYTDLYLDQGREGYHVSEQDRKVLLDLFDRGGQTEGYYRRHNGPDMLVMKEKPAFRQTNQELFDHLDRTYVETEKKEKISGRLTVTEGQPVKLELWNPAVTLTGPAAETARNQPVSREQLEKQMRRTGGTPFEFEELDIRLEGSVFLPLQALNELRREGLKQMEQAILEPFRRKAIPPVEPAYQVHPAEPAYQASPESMDSFRGEARMPGLSLHVLVCNRPQFYRALEERDVAEIQIESDGFGPGEWEQLAGQCRQAGKACVLAMPVIYRREAADFFRKHEEALERAGFDGILVRSLEEVRALRNFSGTAETPLYGDHSLYQFNREAGAFLRERGISRLTYPLELNGRELEDLEGGSELVAYGYLPVMVTAQCIRSCAAGCAAKPGAGKKKNTDGNGNPELWRLRDRTGKELPVKNHCVFCYNTIYNPTPLSLIGMEEAVMRAAPSALRLQFLYEKPDEVSAVIRAYGDSFLRGRKTASPVKEYTRGHMKRGVE